MQTANTTEIANRLIMIRSDFNKSVVATDQKPPLSHPPCSYLRFLAVVIIQISPHVVDSVLLEFLGIEKKTKLFYTLVEEK